MLESTSYEIAGVVEMWQLRKDGKWLDLNDQSEELYEFLVGVLG